MLKNRNSHRQLMITALLALGSLAAVAGAAPAAADWKPAYSRTCWDTCKAHELNAQVSGRVSNVPLYTCRAKHSNYGTVEGINAPHHTSCLVVVQNFVYTESEYDCWC